MSSITCPECLGACTIDGRKCGRCDGNGDICEDCEEPIRTRNHKCEVAILPHDASPELRLFAADLEAALADWPFAQGTFLLSPRNRLAMASAWVGLAWALGVGAGRLCRWLG